jgi:outer membrane lipase/esterase
MLAVKRSLLAAAVGLTLATPVPALAQFSNAYFFGDSLTDAGSFKPVLPAGTGLFTTNPGPIWVTPFAAHFGLTATPANQGGNDYAYGGANVTATPGYPAIPPTVAAVPIANQITQYLATGPADPNALYTVWGGANDLNAELQKVFTGQETQAQAVAKMGQVAKDLVAQVARLSGAGARYILFVDVPNVGMTPDAIDSGQAAAISAFTQNFNATVAAGLDSLGVQTIRLNTYGLLSEVLTQPSVYGFTNVTQRACGPTPALICTAANLVTPDAAQTYAFADGDHPTTALNAIFGQYAYSVVAAPQQMGVLAEAPLAVEQANWRTLDGRMVSSTNAPNPTGKFEAWAAYDYSAPDYSSDFLSGNGDVNTISVGGDMKLSQRLLAGIMFNYSENKADYGGLGFKLREPMGTVYVGYGEGPWYLGATLGGGSLDFSTTRNIALGAATRTESGTTKGWQFVGRLVGGYWFKAGDWVHGPTVKLTYQEVRVRQFSEDGASATTMTFGQQERTSFVTSLGWQLAGQLGAVRPFARASWEYEGQADERSVSASVYAMGGSFSVPAYKPDDSWALFNAGLSADFGKVTGYLTGSATAGKGDGDNYAITVGLRVPL